MYFGMFISVRDKWESSLQLIRVANEDELAVVESLSFSEIAFLAIQPDAHFLFRKTIALNAKIAVPRVTSFAVDASVSFNISPDPFAIIHTMPDLRDLSLLLDESVKRVEHFTPSLPELQYLSIHFDQVVEFNPTAFDLLPCLKKITITRDSENILLDKFETGLVAACFEVWNGFKLLKLNSAAVANIKDITMFTGMVESTHPLSGLKTLQICLDETTDLSIYFRQFNNLEFLTIKINDLSQLNQGQLSCLPSLKRLCVNCKDSVTESIYFND
jgi:hypothetical protein